MKAIDLSINYRIESIAGIVQQGSCTIGGHSCNNYVVHSTIQPFTGTKFKN